MNKKDAYFFSHDSNARHDPKIISLISKYKIPGYAYFFILIEILREQKDYKYPLNLISALAIEWQCPDNATALEIINNMVEIGLIIKNETHIWSQSLLDRMSILEEKKQKRSEAGRLGAKALWQTHGNPMANAKQRMAIKLNESKSNKIIEYSPEFLSFWNSTNKKGNKEQAFTAFNNRLITHSLEDIQKAHSQMQREKQGNELKFYPDVSTFLNSNFDGYHERSKQVNADSWRDAVCQ